MKTQSTMAKRIRLIAYTYLLIMKVASLSEVYDFINFNFDINFGISKKELARHMNIDNRTYPIKSKKIRNTSYYYIDDDDILNYSKRGKKC